MSLLLPIEYVKSIKSNDQSNTSLQTLRTASSVEDVTRTTSILKLGGKSRQGLNKSRKICTGYYGNRCGKEGTARPMRHGIVMHRKRAIGHGVVCI